MRRFLPEHSLTVLACIAFIPLQAKAQTAASPPNAPAPTSQSTPKPSANAPGPVPAPSPAANPPAPSAPEPHVESLNDVRLGVSRGQLKGLDEMCDRLAVAYEQRRDEAFAKNDRQGLVDSFMACYCRYVKAQVLALGRNYPDAEAAIDEARNYRKLHTETSAKGVMPIWQELEAVSTGLILEKQGKLEEAKTAYLQAPESAKATGRLAILELSRNKIDAAKSWALIHANDPTSQFVLAQISARQGRPVPALQEVNRAFGHFQKELATGSEYMPAYYCELPEMNRLRAKLQKLVPPPPKPAPAPQKPAAKAPAGPTTPPAPSPASSGTPPPQKPPGAPPPPPDGS